MIVVGTTLAAFVMDQPDTWGAWLSNAHELASNHPDVSFFAAIEVDARGLAPFAPLLERFQSLIDGGIHCTFWTYSLDDGRTQVTTKNRLRHITAGQNLVMDYATSITACTHVLFMAADCKPDPLTFPKLLACNYPFVGGHVPTYCFKGEPFSLADGTAMELHMPTAAYVLVERSLFKRIKWRWDPDTGGTDDPCYELDATELFSSPGWIRMDCIGKHYPEVIGAIESRGHDMMVVR